MSNTPSHTKADQRFDLAEATIAVARLIQVHDLNFISVITSALNNLVEVHVQAREYPAWVEATRGLCNVAVETKPASPDNFFVTALVDIDGHQVQLLTLVPVDTFIPAAEQAVA